jgi:hypothetical protein
LRLRRHVERIYATGLNTIGERRHCGFDTLIHQGVNSR